MTSKNRFHQFGNFSPSSDVVIAKIGSKKDQMCISYTKSDRRIIKYKDISNTRIYQIQFVVERSKSDLYGLLEGMFS